MRWAGLYSCFSPLPQHVGGMSLNRAEQRLFDYIQGNPEERQYWQTKVQTIAAGAGDIHAAASGLKSELWRYHEERSAVVPAFGDPAVRGTGGRTSMKNLAEHLLRLWVAPRPKTPPAGA